MDQPRRNPDVDRLAKELGRKKLKTLASGLGAAAPQLPARLVRRLFDGGALEAAGRALASPGGGSGGCAAADGARCSHAPALCAVVDSSQAAATSPSPSGECGGESRGGSDERAVDDSSAAAHGLGELLLDYTHT